MSASNCWSMGDGEATSERAEVKAVALIQASWPAFDMNQPSELMASDLWGPLAATTSGPDSMMMLFWIPDLALGKMNPPKSTPGFMPAPVMVGSYQLPIWSMAALP